MVMNASCDSAKQAFDLLAGELENQKHQIITETDTRFQIVDRMLVEVLGWLHSDISTERRAGKGYLDYLIRLFERNKIVIEAKRGSTILIDSISEKQEKYKLSGPVLKSSKEGVIQAREYCVSKSVRYAVLTSGYSMGIFLGYT